MESIREKFAALHAQIVALLDAASDETRLRAIDMHSAWRAGGEYAAGDVVRHGDGLYRVIQPVTALESQPPDTDGMLAIYRPIVMQHIGGVDDPIPYVQGMDVQSGLYYSYNGLIYLASANMPACVWLPDSGIWQWDAVAND